MPDDPPQDPRPRPPRVRLGPDFTKLLGASAVSNLGDGVFLVALPLLAATITRSPGKIAAVYFAGRLPWLLFALVSGALVDRWDRRRVMWVVDLVRGLVVAAMAAAVVADRASIAVLMVGAFLLGVGETLFDNASQSIVPTVVGRDPGRLEVANGRIFGAEIVANEFTGPPLGGFLFTVSRSVPFFGDALSFFVSSALIGLVHAPHTPRPEGVPPTRIRHDIAEGLRWLWGNRLLRTLAAMVGAANLVGTAGQAVLVLFAEEKLGVGPVGFSVLGLGGAAGAALGSGLAARLTRRLGAGNLLVASAFVTGAVQLAVGLVSQAWAVVVLFTVSGFLIIVWNVITVSLRQHVVPEHLMGRVNSVYRLLAWGTMPVGAALGGFLATHLGLRAPFVIGGVFLLVVAFVCLPVVNARTVAAARGDLDDP